MSAGVAIANRFAIAIAIAVRRLAIAGLAVAIAIGLLAITRLIVAVLIAGLRRGLPAIVAVVAVFAIATTAVR